MEGLGAVGIGLVVGWLLPSVRVAGERAAVASAGIIAAVAAAISMALSLELGGVTTASALVGAFVHALWREDLRRRYRSARS
jgi:uncharacterized membrane protein